MTRSRNHANGSSSLAEFDPFAAQAAPQQQPDESPVQILLKIHRLLRGRYIIAIVLAAIGALAGAAAGFFSTKPKWQSNAFIKIEPIQQGLNGEREMPFFDSFVQEQLSYLENQKTVDRAIASKEWQAFGRGLDMKAKNRFKNSLIVGIERNSRKLIFIRFIDENKDAALVGVRQIIDSYKEVFGPGLVMTTEQKVRMLKREVEKHQGDVKSLEAKLAQLRREYATTDLASVQLAKLDALRIAEEEFDAIDKAVRQIEATTPDDQKKQEAPAPAPVEPPKPTDWKSGAYEVARVDRTLNDQMVLLDEALSRRSLLKGKYAPTSPVMIELEGRIQGIEDRAKERYNEWMTAHNNTLPSATNGATPVITNAPIETLRLRRNFAKAQVDRLKAEAIKISDTRDEIETVQGQITAKRTEQRSAEERLNLLNIENSAPTNSTVIGRVEIVSEGEEPTMYSDNRKKLAALGFLLGGSFPVLVVMLLGAVDRRFRYSEDAQAGASRVPLLGILPYLPDVANDPDQAGIAAHCVHQIRTLLQIGGVEHDRKVFAVTSATSGDGKTSLSLSLGLSFAASGSNTLLIDFDMIGGGLTANMGARSDVGILAAIDDGQLEGHVRPTAFPRLSLIPAGRDDAQEISRLSPKLVRRLIDEARASYDVVIIDTGPILGSIEATLVCGIADGVVLALGRGQHKGTATRAIDTLRSVGAHIMGVVFNRAQAGDFKRTVSQSVRSIPVHDSGSAPTLKALPSLGPMARTVASHLRSDG